jgi:hypothetical protein
VIPNIPMDSADETDNCGGAGSGGCTPDTANPLVWRISDIPGLPLHVQPSPKIRAAYWFAVTLTDGHGWKLIEVGTDIAAGGFIADIPGETMAIYPASMSDDRTAASALARLLGAMSAKDTVIVAALVDWPTVPRPSPQGWL